jgi:exonuclease SbcC
MILKKLIMKNIRSYKEIELDFPIGSILLSGDIGSGKTSILLGLQFALFGLQPGQKGASLIRAGENEAFVYLEFEIDGKKIEIERTIKKSKSGAISQDSSIITINGEKEELSTSEAKNKIISLLEYPQEFVKKSNLLYKYTVYTPQESMKEIIQENPDARLDTLRHIFGIDRYKRIKENSEVFIQKIKETVKFKEIESRDVNVFKEKLNQENEKKIKLSKEVINLNVDYNNLLKLKEEEALKISAIEKQNLEKSKLNAELMKKEAELAGKKELKSRTEKEIESKAKQLKEKVEFSAESLVEVSSLLAKHKQFLDELNNNFLKTSSDISVLLSRKDYAFGINEKVLKLDNCPTCFQPVNQEHKDKINKRTKYDIEEIDRELEQKIVQKNSLIKDIEKEKQLIKEYEHDKQEMEKAKITYQHQKENELKLKSDIIVLERINLEIQDIEKIKNELKNKVDEYKEVDKNFSEIKSNFENISQKTRAIEIGLAQKNKELELIKLNILDIEKNILKMDKIRERVNYFRNLQDWMEGKFLPLITLTETNVLAKLRADFSKLFSEWFSLLVPPALSVRLDESFTPLITNLDYEIEYEFLSGGERTAVALAYRLALNQILNSMLSRIKTKDILILDEPTDGFSEQQLDKVRDIFEQLNSKQLILVSHEQKIEGFVDNVIRIKKDGVSCIDTKI